VFDLLVSGVLTVKCWKSHALRMLVATLGKMPRFFWFFLLFESSSSSPVLSPLPMLALLASPNPIPPIRKYVKTYSIRHCFFLFYSFNFKYLVEKKVFFFVEQLDGISSILITLMLIIDDMERGEQSNIEIA